MDGGEPKTAVHPFTRIRPVITGYSRPNAGPNAALEIGRVFKGDLTHGLALRKVRKRTLT